MLAELPRNTVSIAPDELVWSVVRLPLVIVRVPPTLIFPLVVAPFARLMERLLAEKLAGNARFEAEPLKSKILKLEEELTPSAPLPVRFPPSPKVCAPTETEPELIFRLPFTVRLAFIFIVPDEVTFTL